MKQYLEMMQHVLNNGTDKGDRTGTGTRSIFGYQMRFDLQQGLPVTTTKKLHMRSIIIELLWFLTGDTNIKYLQENNIKIWDDWADEKGELGPVYGEQWRAWKKPDGTTIDQISNLIETIKNNPNSRRILVVAYNPGVADEMALPPCHSLFQFYVANGKLSCQLYQRSGDIFLGVPFNIASYAILTHMIAQQCELDVGEFIWSGGDVHLYSNHVEQAKEQLSRETKALPKLNFKRQPKDIFSYTYEDFEIIDYQAEPNIKAPISV